MQYIDEHTRRYLSVFELIYRIIRIFTVIPSIITSFHISLLICIVMY